MTDGQNLPRAPSARPPARGTASRLDWLLFGILCLATIACWSAQYHPFVVPNNDYYSFERSAQALGSGTLPASFKRAPVFPLLFGLLARALPLPESHPELHAALVLNMAFSIGALALLFLLAARSLGSGALLVPILYATTEQFHDMALQPLAEPSVGFFCLLTLVLFQARSPWQYAAAAAAALARYEAATLIPVLFLLNWWRDGRLLAHAARSALASLPLLAWIGLGAMRGSGGSSYLRLMEGMGWTLAPSFLWRTVREPFAGWFVVNGAFEALFLALAAFPTVAGVVVGWREFRREAVAMLAFLGLSVTTVVLFGIDKPRYVYATEWIVFFFFSAGALRLIEAGHRRLAPRLEASPALRPLLVAVPLALVALGVWILGKVSIPEARAPVVDLAFLALALALALVHLWRARQQRFWLAACCLLVAVITPVAAGGIAAKQRGLFRIYYASYSSHLLATWLEENLQPADRVVLLQPTHIRFLTGLDSGRFEKFSKMRAESAAELAAEMKAKGLTHVAYTYRHAPRNPAAEYYYRTKKTYLAEQFRDGGEVAGFEHVATLAPPEVLHRSPVQVYRVLR
jgi:hypothetical protein